MIRSQIPLSLPPILPALQKKKNLEEHWEERKARSFKWPRCQSSTRPRKRRSGSGLLESAIREPALFFPKDGRGRRDLLHLCQRKSPEAFQEKL